MAHLLRWILLRIPILRGLFLILLLTYFFLPLDAPGQSFLGYLSLGYAAGAAVIGLPAFIIFFVGIYAFIAPQDRGTISQTEPIDDHQYALLTNLTGLGAIAILALYLADFESEYAWAVWITSVVAIAEIAVFIWRGNVETKAQFFRGKAISAVFLYGLMIFYLIATDGDLGPPEKNYRAFYTVVIVHLVAETIIFKELSSRKSRNAPAK